MKIVILSGNLIKDSNEKVVAEAAGKQAFKDLSNLIQKE
jgi:NAD(P)H-dependent FMN reductase